MDIILEGKDCFFNKDYDVLKINVKSEKLKELNELTKSNLNYTSQYNDYKPHLTLAYLKKGKGLDYINPTFTMTIDSINKIVYSKPNGEKIDIPLL
jgi:2'-5' RNA ligase